MKGFKILVVDGHQKVAETTAMMLIGYGFEAIACCSVESALMHLLENHEINVVVASNCCMKGRLDGMSLIRIMRQDMELNHIIFIGIWFEEEDKQMFIENGASAVLKMGTEASGGSLIKTIQGLLP